MKKCVLATSVFLLCLDLIILDTAMGHEGGHDLTTEQAMARAARAVASIVDEGRLIGKEKLDASWKKATAEGTCEENSKHYLIGFPNREVGKTLYVLLTIEGAYMRSNFDGVFSDLTFSPYPLQDCH